MLKLILCFFIIPLTFAFDWQGHRGARGLYPENTIGAMEEALKFPVNTLELDVVISKDHKVVVSHEPWMNPDICSRDNHRARGKSDNLYKMNYEEIQKWDCGSSGNKAFPRQLKVSVGKPLLSRLIQETDRKLKALNRLEVVYNVEIKSSVEAEKTGHQPPYEKFTKLVINELQKYLPTNRFTVQSFDWRVLKYIKKNWPQVAVVALKGKDYTAEEVLKELGFNPEVFSPYYKLLTKEHVERFHALNIKVIPWTVNSLEDMRRMISLGVDGIITDYPNLIHEIQSKTCPDGKNLFEGNCVEIPTHALPSEKNPGWICKPGYQQKRSRCVKINIPENAHLLEDGTNWTCDEGYERYRGSCKKK